jgi:hypothetical protein
MDNFDIPEGSSYETPKFSKHQTARDRLRHGLALNRHHLDQTEALLLEGLADPDAIQGLHIVLGHVDAFLESGNPNALRQFFLRQPEDLLVSIAHVARYGGISLYLKRIEQELEK